MSGQRIAVLGAGPMGLGVAWRLVQAGHRPVLFDPDDRLGGQAASFDFDGLSIERFFHYHCTSDDEFFGALDELGLADKLRWVPTRMGFYHGGKVSAWGEPLALLRFPGLSLAAKIRYGLHSFLCTRWKDWSGLDAKPAIPWLKAWVGEEAFDVLWRKLFELKFYHHSDSISAAWIWSRVRRMGRSRYNLMREKLGYLEGGSETLLKALQAAIEGGGGEVRLRSGVTKVRIADGRVQGVELAGGAFEAFDKVVSTVPLPYVAPLMPDLPEALLEQYRAVQNNAVVCVIAKLRKPVSDKFWLNINDPDMDIPGLIEYSNLRPLDCHVVYVPFYMPGEHPKFQEPDEAFIARVRRYIRAVNPAIGEEDFIALHASRYRYAQPICKPGHLGSLPPMDLPVRGLWAADTAYYYPEDRSITESLRLGRRLAEMASA